VFENTESTKRQYGLRQHAVAVGWPVERVIVIDSDLGQSGAFADTKCESFMKTLKHEEVHRVEYRNLAAARRGIGAFLEKTYNTKRLHSALGYRPPAEFDQLAARRRIPA
jgi:hypothetical protein